MNHVNRAQSIARRQNAVEGGGRAATLDVSEYDRTGLEAGALFNFTVQNISDAAEFGVAELVLPHVLQDRAASALLLRELRPFGDNHDGKITSAFVALPDRFCHLDNVERPLWNENDVGAAGNAAIQCDPACIAPHHFHDHDPVVSLGGSVEAVNRFAHSVARGVKSKCKIGAAQIVVDSLGDSDTLDPCFVELLRDRKRIVTANRNQGSDLMFLKSGGAALDPIGAFRRIGTRGPQNGPAPAQNAAHRGEIERHAFIPNPTTPALEKTDEFVVVAKQTPG